MREIHAPLYATTRIGFPIFDHVLCFLSSISRQVVVNLIGSTTTREGLRIKAGIDENTYAKGIKVTDEELATLAIERDEFHGEWNYRLSPRNQNVPS